jgi:ABC-type branched-subunit amino acid transport system ATPase component
MGELMALNNIRVHFGGVRAVDGVSLSITKGMVHGLVGPNGSGKTTLLNAISGVQKVTSGRILLDNVDVTAYGAHRMSWSGVARTFQTIKLLPSLTVRENVMLGVDHRGPRAALSTTVAKARVDEALARLEIVDIVDRYPDELSYGTRRRVEIARAVAVDPQLVLLDEPLAGMNRSERDELAEVIRGLADGGVTQLVIEHDLRTMLSISDRLFVMNFGQLIADGDPREVAARADVREVYLGAGHDAA